MPQTRFVADAIGVVTICFIVVLVLLGLFCIIYSFYFRNQIHSQGLDRFSYFSGPWIIRIICIFFSLWWCVGEIIRLNLLRHNGRILENLSLKWQENVCKCYIVSNMGFAEPCLFLTLILLLRASLQKRGPISQNWSKKTVGVVFLCCFPVFILQLLVILVGPHYREKHIPKLPSYFFKSSHLDWKDGNTALCTYPLLSSIILGLFATMLTAYLCWLGRRILHLVINKVLQRRVYALIFSISSLLPLRVLLLGLSILSKPEMVVFNAIVFLAFLSFLLCAGLSICILVYLPIADSLALRSLQRDIEARTTTCDIDTISLVANQSPLEGSTVVGSPDSSNRGSISLRAMQGKNDDPGSFVELSLFSSSQHQSPQHLGWPMISHP